VKRILAANGTILYHENIGVTEHGYWVEAKDLREGDVFLGANGELSILVSTERVEFPDGITVYNFTVDSNHNYFVIAETDELGQTCILVHNTCVYQATKDGKVTYVGITDNISRRTAEHSKNTRFIREIEGFENLTRSQARAIEQALIEKYGLANLDNKINSIAPKKITTEKWRNLIEQAREEVKDF
jgi:predicted GIY-YIG superfamily endonuclease